MMVGEYSSPQRTREESTNLVEDGRKKVTDYVKDILMNNPERDKY
jgi:hypothetical protein